MSMHIPGLYIAHVDGKGRGVFTAEPVSEGDLIELCPVLVLSPKDLPAIHATQLHDYYFLWGEKRDHCAIALGYGSLYNHADEPNAEFELDFEDQMIAIRCIRSIAPGEEITIHYQPDGDIAEGLWFQVK